MPSTPWPARSSNPRRRCPPRAARSPTSAPPPTGSPRCSANASAASSSTTISTAPGRPRAASTCPTWPARSRLATEVGIQPIVDGAATLQLKAEDMTAALEAVRAAFDETARAAEGSRAMTEAASQLSDQVIRAVIEISEQMRRGSGLGREAVERANASRATIDALTKAADQIGDIVTRDQSDRGADQSARAQRHHRSGARGRSRARLLGGRLRGQDAGDRRPANRPSRSAPRSARFNPPRAKSSPRLAALRRPSTSFPT